MYQQYLFNVTNDLIKIFTHSHRKKLTNGYVNEVNLLN